MGGVQRKRENEIETSSKVRMSETRGFFYFAFIFFKKITECGLAG